MQAFSQMFQTFTVAIKMKFQVSSPRPVLWEDWVCEGRPGRLGEQSGFRQSLERRQRQKEGQSSFHVEDTELIGFSARLDKKADEDCRELSKVPVYPCLGAVPFTMLGIAGEKVTS